MQRFCSEIKYSYPTEIGIYTQTDKGVHRVNPVSVLDEIGLGEIASSMQMNNISVCTELVDSETMRDSDYELVAGTSPEAYNQVVLIVNENNEVTDYTLYALGLRDTSVLKEDIQKMQQEIAEQGSVTGETAIEDEETTYTYDDLMNLDLRLVIPTDYYEKQEDGTYLNMQENEAYMEDLVADAEQLHVVGVVRTVNDNGSEYGKIGYTTALTEYVVSQSGSQ